MHIKLSVLVLVLGAAPALAGSKLQMNILPTPPDCAAAAGPACLNSGVGCGDIGGNTDCVTVGVSSKSKVSLDGNLILNAKLKGVVDNSNAPVTTGAEGAADNYVLQIGLQTCTVDVSEIPYCTAAHDVFVKVVLAAGAGKIKKLDLKPVLGFSAGTALRVNHVALITPRGGGNCLGTNSTVDLTARLNDATCNNGVGILGVGGVVVQ
jgi:hypothetical protein